MLHSNKFNIFLNFFKTNTKINPSNYCFKGYSISKCNGQLTNSVSIKTNCIHNMSAQPSIQPNYQISTYKYFKNNYLNTQYNTYQIINDAKTTKLFLSQLKTQNEAIKLTAYIKTFNAYDNFIIINNANNKILFDYLTKLKGSNNYYLINDSNAELSEFYSIEKYIMQRNILSNIIMPDI